MAQIATQNKKLVKRSKSLAKKQAWNAFSKFIRTRDCISTTGRIDMGRCFTCGRVKRFEDLQAGHFVAGRSNSVLFDELGVNAQCKQCNLFHGGEPLVYRKRLVEKHGEAVVVAMEMKRYMTKSYSIEELDMLRQYYTDENIKMERDNGARGIL